MRQQTDWMLEILSDAKTSGALVVSTPEEMPVTENDRALGRLEAETSVGLAGVVVNRVLPELFGTREERAFESISGPGPGISRRGAGRPSRAAPGRSPADGKDAPVPHGSSGALA